MPIKIPADLPACAALESENIFVMTEDRAVQQDIRPLEIVIVNLMPTKIATETQLLPAFHSPYKSISPCCALPRTSPKTRRCGIWIVSTRRSPKSATAVLTA